MGTPYPHNRAPRKSADGRIFAYAAASDSILKGRAACGKCYQLTRIGGSGPVVPIVLKVDNWCPCQYNPSCCQDHFDIAVPGFDYASSSASNVCQKRDPSISYKTGAQACQNWYLGGNCNCNAVSTDPVLNAGCSIFLSMRCDNCQFTYAPIACPF